MAIVSLGLLCGGFVLLVVKIISSLAAKRQIAAEAARQGCSPVLRLPSKDLLGLTTLLDMLKATKEERGPQYIMERMNTEAGKDVHTVQIKAFPGSELVLTRDPENVKAIFVMLASSFDIGPWRSGSFEPLLGLGIFTLRGEAWKHSRALLRPQFSREQVADLALEARHVDTLSSALRVGPDRWTDMVDLQPCFFKLTLELMTEFLYGQSPSQMDERVDAPDVKDFGYHFDAGKAWLNTRLSLGKWHWLIKPRTFVQHCEQVHTYVDYFVNAKFQVQNDLPSTDEKRSSLLNELRKHTENPLELRSETLNILSAGRDTTASLLSWIFYFLSRSPVAFSHLRTTILTAIGPSRDSITFAELQSCTYLHHVINETLRLAAIVPMYERVALEDTTLPRGGGPGGVNPIFIPKGQRVLICTHAMHHREDIWGEDSMAFKPERWEGRKTGMEFVPFSAGPRKCIGRKLGFSSLTS